MYIKSAYSYVQADCSCHRLIAPQMQAQLGFTNFISSISFCQTCGGCLSIAWMSLQCACQSCSLFKAAPCYFIYLLVCLANLRICCSLCPGTQQPTAQVVVQLQYSPRFHKIGGLVTFCCNDSWA